MSTKIKRVPLKMDGTPVDMSAMDEETKAAIEAMQDELGFGPEEIIRIAKSMPKEMTGSGLIAIVVNVMSNYGMLPQTPQFISGLMMSLKELHDECPDLFKEGGVERMKDEMRMAESKASDKPKSVH